MQKLIINGGKPLNGTIEIRGAKNFVSKAMVASLLSVHNSTLTNVPEVSDVYVVEKLLRLHGVQVSYDKITGVVNIHPSNTKLPDEKELFDIAGTSRIPILFCGPLLHRLKKAFIPALGGDLIGARPVNFHIEALKAFGAEITRHNKYGFFLEAKHDLIGTKIKLEYPSVGATEQILLTAVLCKGITELSNAAIEPEIIDLIAVLQKMGAIISVDTDRVIKIEGVSDLDGYTHTALPDRIEAASWASAALATEGNIFIKGAKQLDLITYLNVFRKIGGEFDISNEGIRFYHTGKPLKPIALETDVHPGFMTDWQQPLIVALTQSEGLSVVHETVYEGRLGFTNVLNEMGAQIQLYKECLGGTSCRFGRRNFIHSGVIHGRSHLRGTSVVVPDIRGGFSYIIAAMTASGVSHIDGMSIINRGYENFMGKLAQVGVDFTYE